VQRLKQKKLSDDSGSNTLVATADSNELACVCACGC